MKNFWCLLKFDLLLQTRQSNDWASLVLFFIIVILLLPFALGPEPELLRRLAPGFIWLAALLMSLLALDKMFLADARDGALDSLLLASTSLPLLVLSKCCAQITWMLGTLVILLAPSAILLGLNISVLPVLFLTFCLGVPILVFMGGIVAAITLALPRNTALLTLLLVPFYIPVLIFSVAACEAVLIGQTPIPHLCLLGALLALLLPVAPYLISSALRNAQS